MKLLDGIIIVLGLITALFIIPGLFMTGIGFILVGIFFGNLLYVIFGISCITLILFMLYR